MNTGAVITPDAGKFLGTPNYAEAYTTEEALPVYLGEGEIMMATLAIDAIVGKIYVADKYQLTYTFTPNWQQQPMSLGTPAILPLPQYLLLANSLLSKLVL
jgi:hypothetical protein